MFKRSNFKVPVNRVSNAGSSHVPNWRHPGEGRGPAVGSRGRVMKQAPHFTLSGRHPGILLAKPREAEGRPCLRVCPPERQNPALHFCLAGFWYDWYRVMKDCFALFFAGLAATYSSAS